MAQETQEGFYNTASEDCWQTFNAVIKPQIEQLISSYFTDWQAFHKCNNVKSM